MTWTNATDLLTRDAIDKNFDFLTDKLHDNWTDTVAWKFPKIEEPNLPYIILNYPETVDWLLSVIYPIILGVTFVFTLFLGFQVWEMSIIVQNLRRAQ